MRKKKDKQINKYKLKISTSFIYGGLQKKKLRALSDTKVDVCLLTQNIMMLSLSSKRANEDVFIVATTVCVEIMIKKM